MISCYCLNDLYMYFNVNTDYLVSGEEELQAVSTRNFGLVSSQVSFILKPDDNGAQYRCNATNPATIEPLLAHVQLTVNCKCLYWLKI